MNRVREYRCALVAGIVLLAACASQPRHDVMDSAVKSDPVPPVAAIRAHQVTTPFGASREDPYYWLRDDTRENPEVIGYLEAENAYADAVMVQLQGTRDALFQEITARIQADAQKVVAAFDSINTGIESTGETLSSLWDSLGSGDLSFSQMFALQRELDKESQRRDQEFRLQEDLTRKQIEMMDAQINALNNGDGMIKVTGDGLQPHLEAFMWEILKAIQVRVNADGLKMLLGT